MRVALVLLALAVFSQGTADAGTQNPRTAKPESARGNRTLERETREPEPGSGNAEAGTVEVDPIECWWRSSATAVRVGETFTVILTCSLLDTEAARVVADESRLDPAVVQLTPFEVVAGTHAPDVTTAGRRFFQYSYDLRVLAENVFATAVALPALELTYKTESRVDLGDTIAGRDQTYALPPLAIRVLSIVPDTATDIREAQVATFAELEETRFRGTAMRVGGWGLIALGGLMLALTLVGRLRTRGAAAPRKQRLSDAAVLQGARRELVSIQEQSRGGWTSELAGRALAALRIIGAYAGGRPVTQTLHDRSGRVTTAGASQTQRRSATRAGTGAADRGELTINGRFGRTAVVSAAVTADQADNELRDALARFAAARYGREETFDARLDEGLEAGIRAADRLIASRPRWERWWPR
jgi:hypothetical protein